MNRTTISNYYWNFACQQYESISSILRIGISMFRWFASGGFRLWTDSSHHLHGQSICVMKQRDRAEGQLRSRRVDPLYLALPKTTFRIAGRSIGDVVIASLVARIEIADSSTDGPVERASL